MFVSGEEPEETEKQEEEKRPATNELRDLEKLPEATNDPITNELRDNRNALDANLLKYMRWPKRTFQTFRLFKRFFTNDLFFRTIFYHRHFS